MTTPFRARSSYWLAYTNPSRSSLTLMTPEFRGFVGRRCTNGCLVLHVRRDEFTELVARWKQDFPSLKILRYAKIQRIPDNQLVGGSFYEAAYQNRYDWCVLVRNTGQPRDAEGLWMDITDTGFRAAIVEHLANEVINSGCDGLAIDTHHWDLSGFNAIEGGPELNIIWQANAIAVLAELKARLPDSIVMFNGLWGFKGEEQAVKQGEMLVAADGIAVEFFGVDGHSKVGEEKPMTEWQYFVRNLNTELAAVARTKYATVNGQRQSGVYANYADDYAAGLYCYANFLLGPLDPRHGFHYGNFACAKTARERSGGYDYFDFQDLRIGAPVKGSVTASAGARARAFKDGLVLVAPAAQGAQSFNLERPYHTMAGKVVGPGTRKVSEGAAEILLNSRPTPPPATVKVYVEGITPSNTTGEWMVQPIKSGWYRYKILNLQVRSRDTASAILVRVEIDHDPITHGIVIIRPASGRFARTTKDYPYGETPNGEATNEYAEASYSVNNEWDDLSIQLDDAMGRTCHRVVSLRTSGRVEISLITLSGRVAAA